MLMDNRGATSDSTQLGNSRWYLTLTLTLPNGESLLQIPGFMLDSGSDANIISLDVINKLIPNWNEYDDYDRMSEVILKDYSGSRVLIEAIKLVPMTLGAGNAASYGLDHKILPIVITRQNLGQIVGRELLLEYPGTKIHIDKESFLQLPSGEEVSLSNNEFLMWNNDSFTVDAQSNHLITVESLNTILLPGKCDTIHKQVIIGNSNHDPLNSYVNVDQIIAIPTHSDFNPKCLRVVVHNLTRKKIHVPKNVFFVKGEICHNDYDVFNHKNFDDDGTARQILKSGILVDEIKLSEKHLKNDIKIPEYVVNHVKSLYSTEDEKIPLPENFNDCVGIPLQNTEAKPVQDLLNLDNVPQNMQAELSEMIEKDFPKLLAKHSYDIGNVSQRTGWYIYLHLKKDLPRAKKVYFCNKESRVMLREILRQLEQFGHVKKMDSDFAHPSFLVPRKDKQQPARLVISLKEINSCLALQPVQVLPNIRRMLEDMCGAYYITVLDLKSAYMHFRIFPPHVKRCTFTTPYGVYGCISGCFGLNFLPSWFHDRLQKILHTDPHSQTEDWLEMVYSYLDDIIIISPWQGSLNLTQRHHMKSIIQVLYRLNFCDFRISGEKSLFFQRECKLLGFILKDDKLSLDPKRIEKIKTFPQPETKKQLMGYLGLLASFRDLISPTITNLLAVLSPLTSNKKDFVFKEEHVNAFNASKLLLISEELFIDLPDPSGIKVLYTDASEKIIGGILGELEIVEAKKSKKNVNLKDIICDEDNSLRRLIISNKLPIFIQSKTKTLKDSLFTALIQQCELLNIHFAPKAEKEFRNVIINRLEDFSFDKELRDHFYDKHGLYFHECVEQLRHSTDFDDLGLLFLGIGSYLDRDVYLCTPHVKPGKPFFQVGYRTNKVEYPPIFLGAYAADKNNNAKIVFRSLILNESIPSIGTKWNSNETMTNDLLNMSSTDISNFLKKLFSKSGRVDKSALGVRVKVISYLSKTFDQTDLHRPIFEKEAMALMYCLEQSRPYIENSKRTIALIDSRTSYFLFAPITSTSSVKCRRWNLVLSQNYPNVELLLIGTNDNVSDFLSRIEESDNKDHKSIKIKDMQFDMTQLQKYCGNIYSMDKLRNIYQDYPQCLKVNSLLFQTRVKDLCSSGKPNTLTENRKIEGHCNIDLGHILNVLNVTYRQTKELSQYLIPINELKVKLSNNNIIKIQEIECQDQIKLVQSSESQYEMINGMLYRMNKPYLPPSLIPIALAYGHLIIGHGGRLKLYNWIKNFYYVNSLKKWVKRFVQSCYVCRVTNYSTNRYGEFGTLPMGNYPMELIFMDMVEKLPTSREQYKYALVIVDAYSRYLAAFPVKSNNTNELIKNLRHFFMLTNFRTRFVCCDNGTNFRSSTMKEFFVQLGITLLDSAPYRSESRGIVERYNGVIQSVMKKLIENQESKEWATTLFLIIGLINNTTHSILKIEPAKVIFGHSMFEKGPFAVDQFKKKPFHLPTLLDEDLNLETIKLNRVLDEVKTATKNIVDQYVESLKKDSTKNVFKKGDLVLIRNRTMGPVGVSTKLRPYYKNSVYVVNKCSPHTCHILRLTDGLKAMVDIRDLVTFPMLDKEIIESLPDIVKDVLQGNISNENLKILARQDPMTILENFINPNDEISEELDEEVDHESIPDDDLFNPIALSDEKKVSFE